MLPVLHSYYDLNEQSRYPVKLRGRAMTEPLDDFWDESINGNAAVV